MNVIPFRMCIVCRSMLPKTELLRITLDKCGNLTLDISGKHGGRGAYICHSEACRLRLDKSKALERTFKRAIHTHEKEIIMKELVK